MTTPADTTAIKADIYDLMEQQGQLQQQFNALEKSKGTEVAKLNDLRSADPIDPAAVLDQKGVIYDLLETQAIIQVQAQQLEQQRQPKAKALDDARQQDEAK